MDVGSSLNVLWAGFVWRSLGRAEAGRRLLEAFEAADEQEQVLAGMALVKAGERSVDLIETALASRDASPGAIRLLADIDGEHARAVLRSTAELDGPVGAAAGEALDLLRRIDSLPDEP